MSRIGQIACFIVLSFMNLTLLAASTVRVRVNALGNYSVDDIQLEYIAPVYRFTDADGKERYLTFEDQKPGTAAFITKAAADKRIDEWTDLTYRGAKPSTKKKTPKTGKIKKAWNSSRRT